MIIGIQGYGRMGQMVEELCTQRGYSSRIIRRDDVLPAVDVIVEFTRPSEVWENMMGAIAEGIPFVTGTTGWNDRLADLHRIVEAKEATVFHSSNFSVGVNLFMAANRRLAELMDAHEDYSLRMREIHHTGKVDAPSGTAITLAEESISRLKRKSNWSNEPTSDLSALTIESLRIDEVPGTHEIIYENEIDRIDFKHTAKNRQGFTLGALMAAEWVVGRKGVFGMQDMLEL